MEPISLVEELKIPVIALAKGLPALNDAVRNLDDAVTRIDERLDGLDSNEKRLKQDLDDIYSRVTALKSIIEDVRTDIECLNDDLVELAAYFQYSTFTQTCQFRDILNRLGVTRPEELREKEAEAFHGEISKIAEQEPQYQLVPAIRDPAVLAAVIALAGSVPTTTRRRARRARKP